MVVHYHILRPYLGGRYQPIGQSEDKSTPGRATGHPVGDFDVDDDNDSEQESLSRRRFLC